MGEKKVVRDIDQCIECGYEVGFLVEGANYHLCQPCAHMIETGDYDDGKTDDIERVIFSITHENRKKMRQLNERIRRKMNDKQCGING